MSPSRTTKQKRLKLVGVSPHSSGNPKSKIGATLIGRDMLTLSKPTKRCILAQLSKKPRTLAKIAMSCKRAQSTINMALKSLAEQQLVQPAEPLGRKKQYKLASRINVTVRGQYADFDVRAPSGSKGRLQVSCKIR